MADDVKFSLPGSGYEVISKILHAYALCGEKPVSLDDLAGKAGMDKTLISRNHGFLIGVGLVTGGKTKTLTEQGKELALAISHSLAEDESVAWRRSLQSSPKTKAVLDMIKIQRGVAKDQLPGRIAQSLGEPDSAPTRTGANCLMDIMSRSGLLSESDGKYQLAKLEANATAEKDLPHAAGGGSGGNGDADETPIVSKPFAAPRMVGSIPLNVNIELHLPASSEQSVYDALFKSIRENLLGQ